ncbi:HemK family protein methyltransferase [Nonomuraea sp. NPDC047897]|uniref:HemK family protein methyltransferase n=1 Tax=Nonomuraea sp. NPDC047897 TaxID=3364346 RepID=UPI00371107A5
MPSPLSSPTPPHSLDPAPIVTRLRAAGCVFAEDEARLLLSTAHDAGDLDAMVERRVAGLPLEHVLGWAEFRGMRIAVDTGVFVPRRRSEFLADQATALARSALARTARGPGAGDGGPVVVVDLCCGSGALAAALAAALAPTPPPGPASGPLPAPATGLATRPVSRSISGPVSRTGSRPDRVAGPFELHAVDIDPAAVRCARRNLAAAGGHVHEGDLYQPLPTNLLGRVDVLIASPPYVPTEAIALLPPEAREHEPLVALDGGADGLDIVRRVVEQAPRWLAPGGHLLVETGEQQARPAAEAMARAGLTPRIATYRTLHATAVIGTRPTPPDAPPECPSEFPAG